MRRVAAQPLPLGEGLVDEANVAVLEVAQAAVHHLRGLRRRARGEVVALDQGRAQAAASGVERDAGAGDAAADRRATSKRSSARRRRAVARSKAGDVIGRHARAVSADLAGRARPPSASSSRSTMVADQQSEPVGCPA